MKSKKRSRQANLGTKRSFQDREVWISYFNPLDERFAKDKLEIIHGGAKTASIEASYIKLSETCGIPALLLSFITKSSKPLPRQIIFD